MKKPKSRKFPKAPKQSASLEVWERYHKRCAEIKKHNEEKLKPYKHKASKIASIKSAVSKIKGK